jgi:hypothetical protein
MPSGLTSFVLIHERLGLWVVRSWLMKSWVVYCFALLGNGRNGVEFCGTRPSVKIKHFENLACVWYVTLLIGHTREQCVIIMCICDVKTV